MSDSHESTSPQRKEASLTDLLSDAQDVWSPKPNSSPSATPPDSVILMSLGGTPASDEGPGPATQSLQDMFKQYQTLSVAEREIFLASLPKERQDSRVERELDVAGAMGDPAAGAESQPLQKIATGSEVCSTTPARVVDPVILSVPALVQCLYCMVHESQEPSLRPHVPHREAQGHWRHPCRACLGDRYYLLAPPPTEAALRRLALALAATWWSPLEALGWHGGLRHRRQHPHA